MRVVQITDTHVPADARDQTVLEMLCAVETVDPVVNLQIILDDIRTLDPPADFVIATGDLADRGHPASYRRLRDLLEPLEVPVYASPGNHDWLRSRGIEPVEYGPGFVDAVRALLPAGTAPTAGFDLRGTESLAQLLELGIPPERLNTNAMGAATPPPGVRRVGRGPTNLATLATLAALVVDGAVEVPIAARYPLERIAEAYTFLEAGHLRGKVVVGGGE